MSMMDHNTSVLSVLFAPFPNVMEKPGRGGETFQYVRAVDVIRRLLNAHGLEYSFEIVSGHRDGDYVIVHGRLSHYDGDKLYTKDQFGSAQVKYRRGSNEPLDLGNDFKAAASDAIKKCATLWGVALDLYEPQPLILLSEAQKNEILRLLSARGTPLTDDIDRQLSMLPAEEADKIITALREGQDAA